MQILVGLGKDLRFCILNKFPNEAYTAGAWTTLRAASLGDASQFTLAMIER